MKSKPLAGVGDVFGKLTISTASYMKVGSTRAYRFVRVQCSCGTTDKEVKYADMINGKIKSCGCSKDGSLFITHGLTEHPLYSIWADMKKRCNNPKHIHYADYGDRGISYDVSWSKFENFYSDMSASYLDGLELDRSDNNGDYSLSNCRWVTRGVNCHNRRKRKGSALDSIGVCIKGDKFRAQLNVDGVPVLRKTFLSEAAAAKAYDDASELHYGDRPNKTLKQET